MRRRLTGLGYMIPARQWFPLGGYLHQVWLAYVERMPYGSRWIWAPLCWVNGGHDAYYGSCIKCGRSMPQEGY